MPHLRSGLLCLGFVAALLVGVVALVPVWAGAIGFDLWHLPNLATRLEEGRQEAEELDHQRIKINRRIAAKQEVITSVIENRLTPQEAAARFQELDARAPPPEAFRRRHPGATDEERYLHEVQLYVHNRLHDQPDQEDAVNLRLAERLAGW